MSESMSEFSRRLEQLVAPTDQEVLQQELADSLDVTVREFWNTADSVLGRGKVKVKELIIHPAYKGDSDAWRKPHKHWHEEHTVHVLRRDTDYTGQSLTPKNEQDMGFFRALGINELGELVRIAGSNENFRVDAFQEATGGAVCFDPALVQNPETAAAITQAVETDLLELVRQARA